MNLDHLSEKFSHAAVIHELVSEFDLHDDGLGYWYICYVVNNNKKKLISAFHSEDDIPPLCSFYNFICEVGFPSTVMEASMILEVFKRYGDLHKDPRELSPVLSGASRPWKHTPIIDDILEETNGLLLWWDQLHSILACLYGFGHDERNKFRIDLTLKRNHVMEKAKNMLVPGGGSLYELLHERMLPNLQPNKPNWLGAISLLDVWEWPES